MWVRACVRACVVKCYKTVGITAGEKEYQQTDLRWQTTRSLNPNNTLHIVNETILETEMTRQESCSGGVKIQLCKKCRQFVSPALTSVPVVLWSSEALNV